MRIILNLADEHLAASCALGRIIQCGGSEDHDSRYNRNGNFYDMVKEVSESIGAEIAVHKYFGLDTDNVMLTKFKLDPDVLLPNGLGIEVKWTKYESGQLIIYPNDRIDDIAVLVVGNSPNLRIAGWLAVKDCKQSRYDKGDQPTWWVTQNNLNPIETLARLEHGNIRISV